LDWTRLVSYLEIQGQAHDVVRDSADTESVKFNSIIASKILSVTNEFGSHLDMSEL
jgi:hypothetical protein